MASGKIILSRYSCEKAMKSTHIAKLPKFSCILKISQPPDTLCFSLQVSISYNPQTEQHKLHGRVLIHLWIVTNLSGLLYQLFLCTYEQLEMTSFVNEVECVL